MCSKQETQVEAVKRMRDVMCLLSFTLLSSCSMLDDVFAVLKASCPHVLHYGGAGNGCCRLYLALVIILRVSRVTANAACRCWQEWSLSQRRSHTTGSGWVPTTGLSSRCKHQHAFPLRTSFPLRISFPEVQLFFIPSLNVLSSGCSL